MNENINTIPIYLKKEEFFLYVVDKNTKILLCLDITKKEKKSIGFRRESVNFLFLRILNEIYFFKLVLLFILINTTSCSGDKNLKKVKHDADKKSTKININTNPEYVQLETHDFGDLFLEYEKKNFEKKLSIMEIYCFYIGNYTALNDYYQNFQSMDHILFLNHINQINKKLIKIRLYKTERYKMFENIKKSSNYVFFINKIKLKTNYSHHSECYNDFIVDYFVQNYEYEYNNSRLNKIFNLFIRNDELNNFLCNCNEKLINQDNNFTSAYILKKKLLLWVYLYRTKLSKWEMINFYIGRYHMLKKICKNVDQTYLSMKDIFVFVRNIGENIFPYQDIISKKYKLGIIIVSSKKQSFDNLADDFTTENHNIYSAIYIYICLYIADQIHFETNIYDVSEVLDKFFTEYTKNIYKKPIMKKILILYKRNFIFNKFYDEKSEKENIINFQFRYNKIIKSDSEKFFEKNAEKSEVFFKKTCNFVLKELFNYEFIKTFINMFLKIKDEFYSLSTDAQIDYKIFDNGNINCFKDVCNQLGYENIYLIRKYYQNHFEKWFILKFYEIIKLDNNKEIHALYISIFHNIFQYAKNAAFINLISKNCQIKKKHELKND